MRDPIEELGNEQLYLLATDLRVQLEKGTANAPVLFLLNTARAKARVALAKMVEVDAGEVDAMRSLQQDVRLYGDMIAACQALVAAGREADSLISESDRGELEEIVRDMSLEDRKILGLQQQGDD